MVRLAAGGSALEYQAAANPFKPYVAQLFTPAGRAVLRDAPKDHLHHHALMFAVSVEGVSFWEERPAAGRQVPVELKRERDRLSQSLDWTTSEGKVVLREERSVQLHEVPGRAATLLTWHSRLQAPAGTGSVKLTGSHYYGLGMRFVESMDNVGEFFNSAKSEGESVRGTERLTNAAWCAYTAAVAGRPVTVAVFSHPANLRHPPRMFTMTSKFAYLGATLNLWKEPSTLEAGRPIDLRYGVAAWDGRPDAAAVEALYRRWREL
ncbi:MAG: hypothetical protein FJ399_04715 [Verrucomicrobia bacterium]|nr:hypothetical protein [Verrucomicrobiota bacterium]